MTWSADPALEKLIDASLTYIAIKGHEAYQDYLEHECARMRVALARAKAASSAASVPSPRVIHRVLDTDLVSIQKAMDDAIASINAAKRLDDAAPKPAPLTIVRSAQRGEGGE